MVAKLVDDPVWQALRQASAEKAAKVFENMGMRLLVGGKTVDERDIANEVLFARGFIRGMKFILDQPQASLKEIERELKGEPADGESQEH